MPLNLDTEIVATAYDPSTDSCAYTIERNGKRWTVQVPLAQLDTCGANKQAAATILATCCSPRWMARPMGQRRMLASLLDLVLRSLPAGQAYRRTVASEVVVLGHPSRRMRAQPACSSG
jgi:hypothetical protein